MYFEPTAQFKKDAQKFKKENHKLLVKVSSLIKSIEEFSNQPLFGIGKPELLKGNLEGCYSRRINIKHRLIYRYLTTSRVQLISCFGHYSDKLKRYD